MKWIAFTLSAITMIVTAPSDKPAFGEQWHLPPFAIATCICLGILLHFLVQDEATDR